MPSANSSTRKQASCKRLPPIGFLGVGDVLMGDDGGGPSILKILESRYEFPSEVVLQDLGTPGVGITSFFFDYDTVILLDAVSAKGQPGDVRLHRKDQLVRVPIPQRVSPHDRRSLKRGSSPNGAASVPGKFCSYPLGKDLAVIGCVAADQLRMVVIRTSFGTSV